MNTKATRTKGLIRLMSLMELMMYPIYTAAANEMTQDKFFTGTGLFWNVYNFYDPEDTDPMKEAGR